VTGICLQDSLFFHFKDTDTAYKQQLLSIKNAISCNAKDPEARDWVETVLCTGGVAFDDASFPTLTPEDMMNMCVFAPFCCANSVQFHV
jgi:hypothetical protein